MGMRGHKFLVKCTVKESRAFYVKCANKKKNFRIIGSISISLGSILKISHAQDSAIGIV